jgi:hypothetical protein
VKKMLKLFRVTHFHKSITPRTSLLQTLTLSSPKLFHTQSYLFQEQVNTKDSSKQVLAEQNEILKQVKQIVRYNHSLKLVEGLQLYEQLKSKHLHSLQLLHYNQIIASYVPRKYMFKWFVPYKDVIDMYFQAGKYRAKEV